MLATDIALDTLEYGIVLNAQNLFIVMLCAVGGAIFGHLTTIGSTDTTNLRTKAIHLATAVAGSAFAVFVLLPNDATIEGVIEEAKIEQISPKGFKVTGTQIEGYDFLVHIATDRLPVAGTHVVLHCTEHSSGSPDCTIEDSIYPAPARSKKD